MPTNSGPIINYNQLVEFMRELCLSHVQVQQFGVGQPSDIDVQTNNQTPTSYPLCFMVPQPSTLDRFGKMTLSFSFIVADMAKTQLDLEQNIHNSTLMIMQDILSKLVLTDWTQEQIYLENPVNIIPFIESYNNMLGGWTAEINLQILSPYNLCDAAFK